MGFLETITARNTIPVQIDITPGNARDDESSFSSMKKGVSFWLNETPPKIMKIINQTLIEFYVGIDIPLTNHSFCIVVRFGHGLIPTF